MRDMEGLEPQTVKITYMDVNVRHVRVDVCMFVLANIFLKKGFPEEKSNC